jgi:hypothetical protein
VGNSHAYVLLDIHSQHRGAPTSPHQTRRASPPWVPQPSGGVSLSRATTSSNPTTNAVHLHRRALQQTDDTARGGGRPEDWWIAIRSRFSWHWCWRNDWLRADKGGRYCCSGFNGCGGWSSQLRHGHGNSRPPEPNRSRGLFLCTIHPSKWGGIYFGSAGNDPRADEFRSPSHEPGCACRFDPTQNQGIPPATSKFTAEQFWLAEDEASNRRSLSRSSRSLSRKGNCRTGPCNGSK